MTSSNETGIAMVQVLLVDAHVFEELAQSSHDKKPWPKSISSWRDGTDA